MVFVFLGAPGSGKGTQSKLLAKKFHLIHLSTGDILREQKNSELGKVAHQYIVKGELVPDDIMIDLVTEKITAVKKDKIILDGFPRTKVQAESFHTLLQQKNIDLKKVIYFSINKESLVKRLLGRIVDQNTGEIYHKEHNPPPSLNSKDLFCRSDDEPQKINVRLSVYEKETMPTIDYYREKKILLEIDANKSIDEVYQDLVKNLFPS